MHFLHVGLSASDIDPEKVEEVLADAQSWLRYSSNCWVLWTDQSPQVWRQRIHDGLASTPLLLVCTLHPTERSGWLPKSSWVWFHDKVAEAQGTDVDPPV